MLYILILFSSIFFVFCSHRLYCRFVFSNCVFCCCCYFQFYLFHSVLLFFCYIIVTYVCSILLFYLVFYYFLCIYSILLYFFCSVVFVKRSRLLYLCGFLFPVLFRLFVYSILFVKCYCTLILLWFCCLFSFFFFPILFILLKTASC